MVMTLKVTQVMDKSLKTTVDVINEQNKNNNTNSRIVGITMLSDVSARRFKQLDVEKYGKSSTYNILNSSKYYYSQGIFIKTK